MMKKEVFVSLLAIYAAVSQGFSAVHPSARSGLKSSPSAKFSSSVSPTNDRTVTSYETKLDYDIILYDGVCNFCNAWVDILLRLDVHQKFRFAPLQSATGRRMLVQIGKEADDISSVVLVKSSGESFDKSACVLQVVEALGPPAGPILAQSARFLLPTLIRDSIYDTVASNRYKILGQRDECRCSDPQYSDRFLLNS